MSSLCSCSVVLAFCRVWRSSGGSTVRVCGFVLWANTSLKRFMSESYS